MKRAPLFDVTFLNPLSSFKEISHDQTTIESSKLEAIHIFSKLGNLTILGRHKLKLD